MCLSALIYIFFWPALYKTSVLTTLLLVFYPLSILEIVHIFGNAYKCTFLTLCRLKKEKKLYKPVSLQCIVLKRLLFTAVEWLCFNSPMLWCTDDTICKLFFHLTALDVTFMWLVLNSGRHLCFETCSINGTTLNYSVNTACFLSFFFFLSLSLSFICAYFFSCASSLFFLEVS